MPKKELVYLGIDPGFARVGLGVISYNTGELLHYTYLEDWTAEDLYHTLKWINYEWEIYKTGVEHVHPMSKQGVSSTGKFMKATGIIIGTLNGMRIPFFEITPQKWKTLSPILKAEKGETKTQKKARSLRFVEEHFPEAGFCNMKANKKAKIDMADAICIATYMYESHM